MPRRRLENADEIGVNDIDDETPTASDNDYDSDTTIDYNYEPAAQFAVNETSYPPYRQRLRRHVVTMWITANLEYWCRQQSTARCLFLRELGNSLARSHALERFD